MNSHDKRIDNPSEPRSLLAGSSITSCAKATSASVIAYSGTRTRRRSHAWAALGKTGEQVHRQRPEQRIEQPHPHEPIGGVGVEHGEVERCREQAQERRQRRLPRRLETIQEPTEKQVEEPNRERQHQREARDRPAPAARAEPPPRGQAGSRCARATCAAPAPTSWPASHPSAPPAPRARGRARPRPSPADRPRRPPPRARPGPPARPRPARPPQRGHRARSIDEKARKRRVVAARQHRARDTEGHERRNPDRDRVCGEPPHRCRPALLRRGARRAEAYHGRRPLAEAVAREAIEHHRRGRGV